MYLRNKYSLRYHHHHHLQNPHLNVSQVTHENEDIKHSLNKSIRQLLAGGVLMSLCVPSPPFTLCQAAGVQQQRSPSPKFFFSLVLFCFNVTRTVASIGKVRDHYNAPFQQGTFLESWETRGILRKAMMWTRLRVFEYRRIQKVL